jgi:hypothetical protein
MQPTSSSSRILQPVRPWYILITLLAALLLNFLPTSAWPWMPDWAALLLIFWSIREQRVGMGSGFIFGLAMDVADSSLMGQHALAYVLAIYAASALSRRILWFPLGQQALHILPAVADCPACAIRCSRHAGCDPSRIELLCRTLRRRPVVASTHFHSASATVSTSRPRRQPANLRKFALRTRYSPQNTHDSDIERFRFRVVIAASVVVLGFAILFARFFYLQVIQHDYYATRAEDNRISLVPIAPNRGVIMDRNGIVLARNYTAFTLEITPSKIENLDAMIEDLGKLVEIESKDRRRFRKLLDESRSFESLPIRTRLSDEEVARFAANRYRFPGVEVKARLFRQYPLGSRASHAIGYINRINKTDLEIIEKNEQAANYRGTDHIGKTGLEQKYEFQLHGETGYEEVEIDAGGHAIRSLSRTPPVSGNNLTLTLDAKLQEITETGVWRSSWCAGRHRAVDRRNSRARIDTYFRSESFCRWHSFG